MTSIDEQLDRLARAAEAFVRCVGALPTEVFLGPMEDWSPRDVLAHLIGWNRLTIEGCEQLLRDELPSYFIDPGPDFSKVNARLVRRYGSRDRAELVRELRTSLGELRRYARSIDPGTWRRVSAVRYLGRALTVRSTIEALARDYVDHRRQIERWSRAGR